MEVAIERKLTQERLQRDEYYLSEAQRLIRTGSWTLNRAGEVYWTEETFRAASSYSPVTCRLNATILPALKVAQYADQASISLRRLSNRSPGVRMLGLVALASAVAVAVAEHSEADTSRVIQGVITGVGFLGAGVILHIGRDRGAVHGLSTAATIWLTASLGVLCGLAAWRLLAVALVFTAILLTAGRVAEKWAGLADR